MSVASTAHDTILLVFLGPCTSYPNIYNTLWELWASGWRGRIIGQVVCAVVRLDLARPATVQPPFEPRIPSTAQYPRDLSPRPPSLLFQICALSAVSLPSCPRPCHSAYSVEYTLSIQRRTQPICMLPCRVGRQTCAVFGGFDVHDSPQGSPGEDSNHRSNGHWAT